MKRGIALLLLTSIVLAGCPKKIDTPPEPQPNPIPPTPPPTPTPPLPERVDPPPQIQRLQRVYFDYNESVLTAQTKSVLDANAAILQGNPELKLDLQGHCDERGTTEYNLALGQKRADAVSRYLQGKGIAENRLRTKSFGEERPLSASADEGSWSQNRRVEFKITSGGSSTVQGSTD